MTLEQAIEFCLNMEKEQYKSAHNTIIGDYPEYEAATHFQLASEYKQIVEYLTELKGLKAKEKEPLDVIDLIPQFGITSELNNDIPYYLEFNRDDHIKRVMLVMTDIDKDHISYQYWDTDDNVVKSDRLTPEDFRDRTYTLFTYSGRIFNDVIEYVSQFNITSGIEPCMPYILEITTDDNFERRVIIITDIGTDHIDYKYWTEDEDGVRCPKRATLLPHFFQKGTCKLYRITEEDLK